MAKAKSSRLSLDVTPANSEGNQSVEIQARVSGVPVADLLVVDPQALEAVKEDATEACKDIVDGRIKVFEAGMKIDGLPDEFYALNGPYFRIPSVEQTNNGTIYVISDCRNQPTDQCRIAVVGARSTDGGKNWEYKVLMLPDTTGTETTDYDPSVNRVMDPTTIRDGENVLVLAGRWRKGSGNWNRDSVSYDNWTAAAACMINDSNWSSGNFQVNYNFRPTTNEPSNLKGFLGGGSNGIKLTNGKFVMPIQFFVPGSGVNSALLVSDRLSTSESDWSWSVNHTPSTGGGECAIAEYKENCVEMVVRTSGTKQVFRTDDLGATTWTTVSTSDFAINGIHGNCLHSYLGFKSPAGQQIFLLANPQNDQGGYKRDQITVYHVDRKTGSAITLSACKVLNYNIGGAPVKPDGQYFDGTWFGGYSSMSYNNVPNKDGGMLLVAYEDNVGISLQNITSIIPGLENIGIAHDMANDSLTPEQLETIKQEVVDTAGPQIKSEVSTSVMREVDSKIGAWPSDFSSFIDTHVIDSSNSFSVIGSDYSEIGNLSIGGALLSGGTVDSTKLELSNVLDGGLFFKTTSNGEYTVRGPVRIDSSAEVVSFVFGICVPAGANIQNYTSLLRFFNHATSVNTANIMGGLEITSSREVYLTRKSGAGSSHLLCTLDEDVIYTIAVEYTGSGVNAYLDGKMLGTFDADSSKRDGIRASSYMCIVGQGSNDRHFYGHIGNITIYNRLLTENEKKYGRWINGKTSFSSNFSRSSEISDKVAENESKLNNIADSILTTVGAIGPAIRNIDVFGQFEKGTSIDGGGRTWTAKEGGKQFSWETGISDLTVTKEGDNLRVVKGTASVGTSDVAKYPHIELNTQLSGAQGLTFMVKFKYLNLSTLGDWPSLCSLVKTGSSKIPLFNIGITKSDSTTNLFYNYHVKKDWTNDTTSGPVYWQGSVSGDRGGLPSTDSFNYMTFTIEGDRVKIYSNTTLIGEHTITPIDITNIDSAYLGYAQRFTINTQVEFEEVVLLKRVITEDELRKVCDSSYLEKYNPEWYKDIIARLTALELKP